jgi:phosphatidylglycerophosphatase A
MNFQDRMLLFLATGFCIGKIPIAPGTFGALLGVPLAFGLEALGCAFAIGGAVAFALLAVWIAGRAETILMKKDAGAVVIDEVAGMVITLTGLPLTVANTAVGFALFRALDIIKPFPARTIDRNMGGGLGIVLDDAVAGLYSNLLLRLMAVAVG